MESPERLNKLISYVEENFDGEIDNQTLSRIAAYPLAVLQRLFVLMTGNTLTEYVRLRRLARAADDLRDGKEKVTDIAIKYGYECV